MNYLIDDLLKLLSGNLIISMKVHVVYACAVRVGGQKPSFWRFRNVCTVWVSTAKYACCIRSTGKDVESVILACLIIQIEIKVLLICWKLVSYAAFEDQ